MTQRISRAVFWHPFLAGLIAVILTFSACSSDDGDDTPAVAQRYLYCAFNAASYCIIGPVSVCPAGGVLTNECPTGFSKDGVTAPSPSSSGLAVSSSSIIPSSSSFQGFVYGGKTYKTVKIGEQTWMAENLNYNAGGSSSSGSRCYNNQSSLCEKYGRLYDWATAMGFVANCNNNHCANQVQHRGICPSGWHIPSKAEWEALRSTAGGETIAGKYLKAASGWNNYNGESGNGTDNRNFAALPGGYYYNGFDGIDYEGHWWSSEDSGSQGSNAGSFVMRYREDSLSYNLEFKSNLFSVRCIQD